MTLDSDVTSLLRLEVQKAVPEQVARIQVVRGTARRLIDIRPSADAAAAARRRSRNRPNRPPTDGNESSEPTSSPRRRPRRGPRRPAGRLGRFRPRPSNWSQPQNAAERVDLVVGTGQLIRVDSEFSSLFVANPDVADVEVKSPRLLYLTGVGVGETTLFAVDDNDNVLMSTKIRVTHNIGALQQGIGRVAPGQ